MAVLDRFNKTDGPCNYNTSQEPPGNNSLSIRAQLRTVMQILHVLTYSKWTAISKSALARLLCLMQRKHEDACLRPLLLLLKTSHICTYNHASVCVTVWYGPWPARHTDCVPCQMQLTCASQGVATPTHTHSHKHTFMLRQTEQERGRITDLFFAILFCARSLPIFTSPLVCLSHVLNLSAGHSYDTSK